MIAKMGLETIVCGDLTREITGGYCGDLLSWVMGRAQAGNVWITVMGNVNSIAVSILADTACIVLSENSPLDEEARLSAENHGVTVLRSTKATYQLAVELSSHL